MRNFVVNSFKPDWDFFICCYYIDSDELWTIPSKVFYKEGYTNSKKQKVIQMNKTAQRKFSNYKDDLGLDLLRK